MGLIGDDYGDVGQSFALFLNDRGIGENEQGGSSAYVPPDPKNDKQLNFAYDLLRGIKSVDTETKKKAEADKAFTAAKADPRMAVAAKMWAGN